MSRAGEPSLKESGLSYSWPARRISGTGVRSYRSIGRARGVERDRVASISLSSRRFPFQDGMDRGQGAAGVTREVAQRIEGGGRNHFVRAPPPPIAVGAAGQIHTRLIAEIKNILQWSHSERGGRPPCQVHQGRSNIATGARGPSQISP